MSDDNKIEFTAIIRDLSAEKFAEVFGASSRKARETYFRRHGIKKPKSSNKRSDLVSSSTRVRNEARVMNLFEVLQKNEDDEMTEEIIRVYLLSKRELLATAMDHLEIEHESGLTESDEVDKIKEMKGKELEALCQSLLAKYPKEDVELYLRFMGSEKIKDIL